MDQAKKMDCRAKGEVILGTETGYRPISIKGLPLIRLKKTRFASETAHAMEPRFGDHQGRSRAMGTLIDRIRYGKNSLFDLHSRKSELSGSDHCCRCYKN